MLRYLGKEILVATFTVAQDEEMLTYVTTVFTP
jgi:hypothetical protein